MQIGSIVKTVADFEPLRLEWRFPYPKHGSILTVSNIVPHPNGDARGRGVVLLFFEECQGLIGLADKTIKGEPNFIELLSPLETSFMEELLDETLMEIF